MADAARGRAEAGDLARCPVVGITADVSVVNGRERAWCTLTYARAVRQAGGTPVMLTPDAACAAEQLELCDAIVLTGGDDPRMEPFGRLTHPKATPLVPTRQAFEMRLLELLREFPKPTLGVCLGMQMMALCAGGNLNQHLPDSHADADRHWDAEHPVSPSDHEPAATPNTDPTTGRGHQLRLCPGVVHSRHRQAVDDPGRLSVVARADDGIIEAISDPRLPFYLGVQWHPERTSDEALGLDLFRQLIAATAHVPDLDVS